MNKKLKIGIGLVLAAIFIGGGGGTIINVIIPGTGCCLWIIAPFAFVGGIVFIVMGAMEGDKKPEGSEKKEESPVATGEPTGTETPVQQEEPIEAKETQ